MGEEKPTGEVVIMGDGVAEEEVIMGMVEGYMLMLEGLIGVTKVEGEMPCE